MVWCRLPMNWLVINLAITAPAAYWVYRDAKGRDASPILWTAAIILAGLFFLGPLGAALVLFLYSLFRPKGAMRVCPHCSKRALSWLAFCPHCKGVLKRDCYRCFAAVDIENEFCPHCRAKLGQI